MDRLCEEHLDGKVKEELYARKSKEYGNSIASLKTQLSTFELSSFNRYETVSHLLEVSKNAHKIFAETDYLGKRKILKKVPAGARGISKDSSIVTSGKTSFSILLLVLEPRSDSLRSLIVSQLDILQSNKIDLHKCRSILFGRD